MVTGPGDAVVRAGASTNRSPGPNAYCGTTAFPCRLADITGALLHFKYLPEFAAQVRAEVARGQHYLGAKEYRAYQRRLEGGQSLDLMGPTSRRYEGSGQLTALGLIESSRRYECHVRASDRR